MRLARETVRLYQPLTIVTDKAASYAKVIGEWNARLGPEDAPRHVTRRHENNRIEGDHAVLNHRLRTMRGFQGLSTAKGTLKGIETFRAIRRGDFHGCEIGANNEIAFVRGLFSSGKTTA